MVLFYQNLKQWRLFRGLTQEELAGRSGVSRPNVVALERGRRDCPLSTLIRLSFSLGVSPGSLRDRPPPAGSAVVLRRHQIGRITRSLIAGERDLPLSLLKIRVQVEREAGPLLRAAGIPVRRRPGVRSLRANREAVQKVLGRVARLLPYSLREEAT